MVPSSLLTAVSSAVRRALHDLADLLLPVTCAGCGAWDESLCARCAHLLTSPLTRCEAEAAAIAGAAAPAADARTAGSAVALPTWCVAPYTGPVRGIVVAWKGRRDAVLARAVLEAGRGAGRSWRGELERIGVDGGPVVVVPAPSGWRRRASGRLVVRSLAAGVAAGLAEATDGAMSRGWQPTVVDGLRRGRGRARQSGLGVASRSANRRHSMRLVARLPQGATCLLVDDVLTTGATLAECRRALEEAGGRVAGALVLAATPGSGSVRRPPRGAGVTQR